MTLSKILITRCALRASTLALLAAALAAPPAWAEEIAVGPGKKSLQQALAEAKAGATIVLPEGTTTGDVIAESTAIRSPVGVAVNGDRLAVASAEDGKVHFFDYSDPKKLKTLKTVARRRPLWSRPGRPLPLPDRAVQPGS